MGLNVQQGDPILEIKELRKFYPVRRKFGGGKGRYVHAVDDVSLTIGRGQTLGLVGESGCGKSTIGRCIVRLTKPTRGEILFHSGGSTVDLAKLEDRDLQAMRTKIQMVFQDPFSSINPRLTIGDTLEEPLQVHGLRDSAARQDRVVELLEMVGLKGEHTERFPHELSGGQRQRICIARALSVNPELVICDEPVAALDVSVQAQVLTMLKQLQRQLNLSYLFISHDLAVVNFVSDYIAVMYLGRIVEIAQADELYVKCEHPYTKALVASRPIPDPEQSRKHYVISGDVPDPSDPPSGCYFHTRCDYAQDVCRHERPQLRKVGPDHIVACHLVN